MIMTYESTYESKYIRDCREKRMALPSISIVKYYDLPLCSKGVYEDFDGTAANWKGKKTIIMGCIDPKLGHSLGIEDVHFRIGG